MRQTRLAQERATTPTDARPRPDGAEADPAETKPKATKPKATKPKETKPVGTNPAETNPAEANPAGKKSAGAAPKSTTSPLLCPSCGERLVVTRGYANEPGTASGTYFACPTCCGAFNPTQIAKPPLG